MLHPRHGIGAEWLNDLLDDMEIDIDWDYIMEKDESA